MLSYVRYICLSNTFYCLDCVLDVESESFTLANVMEAPLLEFKEDVEVSKHFDHLP